MVHCAGLFELQLNVQHTNGLARGACIWGKDISIFACQKVSELCLMQIHSDYDFSLKPAVKHQHEDCVHSYPETLGTQPVLCIPVEEAKGLPAQVKNN